MSKETKTVDLEPTWTSLVPVFIGILQNDEASQESIKTATDALYQMASVCDTIRRKQKREEAERENLSARIVEICKPKFCGDTSIIMGAKVKLWGFSDELSYLNGITGITRHPYDIGQRSTKGLVGIQLDPFQTHPFNSDTLNVESDHIMFIE